MRSWRRVLGLSYLKRLDGCFVREGLVIGLIWFAMCVLIDAPLPHHHGNLRVGRGACGRGGRSRWQEASHSILAHAQGAR